MDIKISAGINSIDLHVVIGIRQFYSTTHIRPGSTISPFFDLLSQVWFKQAGLGGDIGARHLAARSSLC